jgi:hypothetical protein
MPERDRQQRRLILGRLRDKIAHAGCGAASANILHFPARVVVTAADHITS